MQIFSKKVKSLIKKRGLTQKKLANLIDEDESNLSRWVTSNMVPDAVQIVKIANYFDISLDELFDRVPFDPKPKIRDHAQKILILAGGDLNSSKTTARKAKKSSKSAKKRK